MSAPFDCSFGLDVIFVLGADDPEMRMIATFLEQHQQCYVYATHKGQRCNAHTAYMTDNDLTDCIGKKIIYVECYLEAYMTDGIIDHHRLGDPGYDLGPDKFWEASSLGQVYKLFPTATPTQKEFLYAAMDHCFNAAVAGECPGIDPGDILALNVHEIVNSTGITEAGLRSTIAYYHDVFLVAKRIVIGDEVVLKIPNIFYDDYPPGVCALRTVAVIKQERILYTCINRTTKKEKICLFGNTKPETVETFMNVWAPEYGVTDVYGVPERGYAGGYFPD